MAVCGKCAAVQGLGITAVNVWTAQVKKKKKKEEAKTPASKKMQSLVFTVFGVIPSP